MARRPSGAIDRYYQRQFMGVLLNISLILMYIAIFIYLKVIWKLDNIQTIVLALIPIPLCILGAVSIKKWKKKRWLSSGIYQADNMSGEEFETFLDYHFSELGYKSKHIGRSNDYGADLILTDKKRKKTIVQAKRYKSKVGIKAIQEVIGAITFYDADDGIVITNSYFTSQARALADKGNITLIDRPKLAKLIENTNYKWRTD